MSRYLIFTDCGLLAVCLQISNAEFLAFVQDNGYNTSAFWTATGWRWKAYRNAKWPSFWVRNGPQGKRYDLHDEVNGSLLEEDDKIMLV